MNTRRLNNDEIKALSIKIRVCFMLQGWNNIIEPKTPKEWAEEVGFFNYKQQGASNKDTIAINKALDDAQYHIDFIRKYILKD